jgi:hypothetical protein
MKYTALPSGAKAKPPKLALPPSTGNNASLPVSRSHLAGPRVLDGHEAHHQQIPAVGREIQRIPGAALLHHQPGLAVQGLHPDVGVWPLRRVLL